MTMRAVVLGRYDDSHVPSVVESLRRHEVDVVHLPLGLPPKTYSVAVDGSSSVLATEDVSVSTHDVRRADMIIYLPLAVNDPPMVDIPQAAPPIAHRAWQEAVQSIICHWYDVDGPTWLIRPGQELLQQRRLHLLQTAESCGLRIPAYIVTNRVEALRSWVTDPQVVVKSVASWEEISPGRYFNARLCAASDTVAAMDSGEAAELLFVQAHVAAVREYRCYVIGSGVAAIAMERDGYEDVDIRLAPRSELKGGSVSIGTDISNRLVAVCNELGIRYCCFDILEAANGDLFLIDVNPVGSWIHITERFGIAMSDILVDRMLHELA